MTHTVDAEWSLEATGGVTLVEVRLRNPTPVDRAVRVETRLDGDVLPPRTDGVAEPGWSADGFAGVVAAGEERALGFAVRAEPARPPVDVTDEGRAGPEDRPSRAPARAARRALRSPRPPRDAIPLPDVHARSGDPPDAGDAPGTGAATAAPRHRGSGAAPGEEGGDGESGRTGDEDGDGSGDADVDLPSAVTRWLAAVEARVERAERLDDAAVPEATTAVAETGGAEGAAELDDRLGRDEARLRAVAERAASLADRAAAAGVPAAALRRLA
jgi:hypothetical protein